MRTGTCEGDSSGSRDTPGHGVIQCCQPRAGWLQWLALHTQWWLPLSPSVSHTAGNRCRVTQPGCPWLPGAGGQRNASSGLWQLPGPGILCPALGTCPVSLLCPCKPTVALPGQRCPFHPPASSRRECPQGGGQGGDRAVQGHGWVFPSLASAPQSSPGQGGCGAVPALLPHAAACRRG